MCNKMSNLSVLDQTFANTVAKLCYDHFKSLPKKGKPQVNKEWTLLSAIVMSENFSGDPKFHILAMCTGTKSLGHSFLSEKGDVISDSHAEVLVRRAFIKCLYHEMSVILSGKKSKILSYNGSSGFFLQPGVKLHLFISHTPCGDASIFPKTETINESKRHFCDEVNIANKKIKACKEENFNFVKSCLPLTDSVTADNYKGNCNFETSKFIKDPNKTALELSSVLEEPDTSTSFPDIYRTGAKCVKNGAQDPKETGEKYHVIGALRTKPGRGDESWSMSCSDKFAIWNICGLQGALMSHLITKPIYLSTIIIGRCPFDKNALYRAVCGRTSSIDILPKNFVTSVPEMLQSDLIFEFSKEYFKKDVQLSPCPTAIIWCDVPGNSLEVCVNGRKQGVTKKNFGKCCSWLSVSRRQLFEDFCNIVRLMPKSEIPANLREVLQKQYTYYECKNASSLYNEAKSSVLNLDKFQGWMKKPKILQMFSLPPNFYQEIK